MGDINVRLVLVLFLSFILVSVPQIQSATSSEPKTTKTGNVTQLWKFPVVGAVCNLPVVKDGFVYVTASYVGASMGYAYCLNLPQAVSCGTIPLTHGFYLPFGC